MSDLLQIIGITIDVVGIMLALFLALLKKISPEYHRLLLAWFVLFLCILGTAIFLGGYFFSPVPMDAPADNTHTENTKTHCCLIVLNKR